MSHLLTEEGQNLITDPGTIAKRTVLGLKNGLSPFLF